CYQRTAAWACQGISLGQGTQDGELRQLVDFAGEALGAGEFDVGLVYDNNGPAFQGAGEAEDRVFTQQVACWVVERAEKDELDVRGALFQDCPFVESEAGVCFQRDRDDVRALN